MIREKLIYYPTVTREPFRHHGRITGLLEGDQLTTDIGMPPLDPANDRVMLCGGPAMLADLQTLLVGRGFSEGSQSEPGHYVVEKAFVEK
jgi:ferredoxin--NADP+ reductase